MTRRIAAGLLSMLLDPILHLILLALAAAALVAVVPPEQAEPRTWGHR